MMWNNSHASMKGFFPCLCTESANHDTVIRYNFNLFIDSGG